jgi:acyl carrier protein
MTPTTERIIELAAQRFQLDPAEIQPGDDVLETLDVDSFEALELLTALEQAFSIELPDYELQAIRTFEELAQAVDSRR